MGLKPVTVSQLNSYIKRILQTDPILGNVSVRGEVSNLKFHGSGHVYFSLKDEKSRINCFLPSDRAVQIGRALQEGMEIIASGYIYLYERGGSYSLNVTDLEKAGQGELAIAFEKLKQKLAKEGLFDQEHKKLISAFPHKVAIVTSETGAAVRDILKIIQKKNNCVDVLVYPVLVQGPGAPQQIADAIRDLSENYPDVDTIITGRGGRIAMEQMRIDHMAEQMKQQLLAKEENCRSRLELLRETVEAADPNRILQKGYTILRDEEGNVILDVAALRKDQDVSLEGAGGFAEAKVVSARKKAEKR